MKTIKIPIMKYRVLLDEINPLKVFSLNNLNSNILILEFIY